MHQVGSCPLALSSQVIVGLIIEVVIPTLVTTKRAHPAPGAWCAVLLGEHTGTHALSGHECNGSGIMRSMRHRLAARAVSQAVSSCVVGAGSAVQHVVSCPCDRVQRGLA